MLELFSKLIGSDYPYEKYAQSVVFNFGAGGMENTSTTTLVESTPLDERAALDHDAEGLISHELAHQWFGDMLTCKSWTHLWLNEGFATYFSHIWDEHSQSRDEYDYGLWNTMRGVAENDSVEARAGVVFPFYSDSGENFGKRVSNPYSKGASALHMLRQSMGDDLFWKVIGTYVKRHAWTSVETDDLRKVCDELSGKSYEQFFQQWLHRAGTPTLEMSYHWNDEKKLATIRVDQKQKISVEAPAFIGEVPLWVVSDDGAVEKQILKIDSRTASLDVKCGKEPAMIAFDPQGAMLKSLKIELPVAMLIRLADKGPTMMSRLNAIAALSEKDRDNARESLTGILKDEDHFYALRIEAAKSLGTMNQPKARDLLVENLKSGVSHHKVRRAVVEAVGNYRDASAAETILNFAKSDASYAVERAATEALANQNPTEAIIAQLLANAEKPSHRDQIRTAAVKALAKLGEQRGIEPAMKLATYGQPFRSRGSGFEVLGMLGKDDKAKDEVRKFLIANLDDQQDRAVTGAIAALGELGDEKAIEVLKRISQSSRQKSIRDRAKEAIDQINKANGESSVVSDLRERVEKLEKAKEKRETEKRETEK